MTRFMPTRDTGHGVATCDKCGNDLIIAEWREHVSDGVLLNFWRCWECGYQFETEECMADIEPKIASNVLKEFSRRCAPEFSRS